MRKTPLQKTMSLVILAGALMSLGACATNTEEKAAVGAGAGAVVGGPVGAAVGGAAGAVVGHIENPHS